MPTSSRRSTTRCWRTTPGIRPSVVRRSQTDSTCHAVESAAGSGTKIPRDRTASGDSRSQRRRSGSPSPPTTRRFRPQSTYRRHFLWRFGFTSQLSPRLYDRFASRATTRRIGLGGGRNRLDTSPRRRTGACNRVSAGGASRDPRTRLGRTRSPTRAENRSRTLASRLLGAGP